MWPPLYSGHLKRSQSLLFNTNSTLKCGHPSNKDTFTGPKGGRFRGVPLYNLAIVSNKLMFITYVRTFFTITHERNFSPTNCNVII